MSLLLSELSDELSDKLDNCDDLDNSDDVNNSDELDLCDDLSLLFLLPDDPSDAVLDFFEFLESGFLSDFLESLVSNNFFSLCFLLLMLTHFHFHHPLVVR